MKALVTGASGFVGSVLCEELLARGHIVRAAVRREDAQLPTNAERAVVRDISVDEGWRDAVSGIDVVFHLASAVHRRRGDLSPEDYQRINVGGTAALTRAAVNASVRRVVFVSSVKAMGDNTRAHPWTDLDEPRPADPYGNSKLQAERVLQQFACAGSIETVSIRPPLVYGPGVGANFLAMIRAVDRGFPLPLGGVRNRRSLIFVRNLVDALIRAAEADLRDNGGAYLVSDGEDLSVPQLLRILAGLLGKRAILPPVPPALLRAAAAVVRRKDVVSRLTESLQVDSSRFRSDFDWSPPFTTSEGLEETIRWYRFVGG